MKVSAPTFGFEPHAPMTLRQQGFSPPAPTLGTDHNYPTCYGVAHCALWRSHFNFHQQTNQPAFYFDPSFYHQSLSCAHQIYNRAYQINF